MNYSTVMRLPECYGKLNVSPGAAWEEIKKSYRVLALKFHPDLHPGDPGCEYRFKEISRAFKTLEAHYQSSALAEYECRLETQEAAPPCNDGEGCTAEPLTPAASTPGFLKNLLQREVDRTLAVDIAQRLQQVLSDWETKVFLLDVKREIGIDPATANHGGVVKVRRGKESFEIPIPPGAWHRMSLRIPARGEASWFRRKRGDLLLDIRVVSSGARVCTGDRDLHYDFPVSREKIENRNLLTLNTVQGPIKFVLPRNLVDGQTFVLKARPATEEALRTNHIVKVRLV